MKSKGCPTCKHYKKETKISGRCENKFNVNLACGHDHILWQEKPDEQHWI